MTEWDAYLSKTEHGASEHAWYAEACAMALSQPDFEAASAAELPDELAHHAHAANADDQFSALEDEWLNFLYGECFPEVLLGLEQSCHDGILLPWDMRGVRLQGIPDDALSKLHFFWRECPAHVAAYVMLQVYWLVRIERARRTGRPDWSCRGLVAPVKAC